MIVERHIEHGFIAKLTELKCECLIAKFPKKAQIIATTSPPRLAHSKQAKV